MPRIGRAGHVTGDGLQRVVRAAGEIAWLFADLRRERRIELAGDLLDLANGRQHALPDAGELPLQLRQLGGVFVAAGLGADANRHAEERDRAAHFLLQAVFAQERADLRDDFRFVLGERNLLAGGQVELDDPPRGNAAGVGVELGGLDAGGDVAVDDEDELVSRQGGRRRSGEKENQEKDAREQHGGW